MKTARKTDAMTRLLAKLVREQLRTSIDQPGADLTEAIKLRCARLRIRWTNDALHEATRIVLSNVRPFSAERFHVKRSRAPLPTPRPVSHVDACAILARLGVSL